MQACLRCHKSVWCNF